jgi:hypothetical protein
MGKYSYPAFVPAFGSGAPGASVSHSAPYYDTSTTPFTPYIYEAGEWHEYGAFGAGNNATALQGTPVDATAPTLGQVLEFNGTDWTPGAGGAVNPAIVQNGAAGGNVAVSSITLGSPPTNGNLLIAVAFSGVTPGPASGWTSLTGDIGSADLNMQVYYRIAGTSESATQTPVSSNVTALGMYEIAPLSDLGFTRSAFGGNAADTISLQATTGNGIVLGFVEANSAGLAPLSISGATIDANSGVGLGGRIIQTFHATSLIGANSFTVTYATSTNKEMLIIAIYP